MPPLVPLLHATARTARQRTRFFLLVWQHLDLPPSRSSSAAARSAGRSGSPKVPWAPRPSCAATRGSAERPAASSPVWSWRCSARVRVVDPRNREPMGKSEQWTPPHPHDCVQPSPLQLLHSLYSSFVAENEEYRLRRARTVIDYLTCSATNGISCTL
jgi:hypothetical protein